MLRSRSSFAPRLRLVSLLVVASALALAPACDDSSGDGGFGGGGGDSSASGSSSSIDVSGEWSTDWGSTHSDMTLSQSGSDVSGTYDLADSTGTIVGTMSGRTLNGTWSDKYGSGDLQFVFSADGDSFDGTWGDNQSWTGTRTSGPQSAGNGPSSGNGSGTCSQVYTCQGNASAGCNCAWIGSVAPAGAFPPASCTSTSANGSAYVYGAICCQTDSYCQCSPHATATEQASCYTGTEVTTCAGAPQICPD